MGDREDFVRVRLTPVGEEVSEGCLWICGGKYQFCFRPGEEVEVTRGEWREILSKEQRDGQPLLEAVENEEEKSIV